MHVGLPVELPEEQKEACVSTDQKRQFAKELARVAVLCVTVTKKYLLKEGRKDCFWLIVSKMSLCFSGRRGLVERAFHIKVARG